MLVRDEGCCKLTSSDIPETVGIWLADIMNTNRMMMLNVANYIIEHTDVSWSDMLEQRVKDMIKQSTNELLVLDLCAEQFSDDKESYVETFDFDRLKMYFRGI